VQPLSRLVGKVRWHAAPAPVQGKAFLEVVGSEDLVEASRVARLTRDATLGDPRSGPASAGPAGQEGPPPGGDTVAITAADDDGNVVTLIQSVYESFGAGLLDPATGVVLHNRGNAFRLEPTHPGRLVPGHRPPHTLCPTIGVDERTIVALGCQGGRNQPWILAQVAGDVLGATDLTAVTARPRWIFDGPDVVAEPGTPGLAGVEVVTTGGPHDHAGHVQVCRLRDGVLAAGSDPRADGLGAILGMPG
jgi:oxamate amidohydrolase